MLEAAASDGPGSQEASCDAERGAAAAARCARHDPLWQFRKQQLQQQIRLSETTVRLAGRELPWLFPADVDEVLEQAIAADPQGTENSLDPFWAANWRSAQGLDQFLSTLDLVDRRVLELGCGTGQAGTSAALRGAFVTSTDAAPLALQIASLNSWFVRDRLQCVPLSWGLQRLSVTPFPIIIGSDLVYEPRVYGRLEATARAHLARNGRLYLSEPCRQSGDTFATWLREAGWDVTHAMHSMDDGRTPIRIFQCALANPPDGHRDTHLDVP